MPESVAALPTSAELALEGAAAEAPLAMGAGSGMEIVVGDVVVRPGSGADEELLTRAIRAARAGTGPAAGETGEGAASAGSRVSA